MPLDAVLKQLLVCPQCRGALEERDSALFCAPCGLLFPIRDGLPVMLIEEATKVEATKVEAENARSGAASVRDAI